MAIDWEQIPPQEPVPGVRTRRTDGEQMTIFRYEMEPGANFPLHQHPEEQLVVVLAGSVTFRVGEEELYLERGMSARMAPEVPHAAWAGNAGVQFLNILAPRRIGNTICYVASD